MSKKFNEKTRKTEGNNKPVLTAEAKKAYAKECTRLAKENDLPFDLVLFFHKDIEKLKNWIEVCSNITVERDTELHRSLVAGGSARVEAMKTLGIPFKGINVDKLPLMDYIKVK